MGLFNNIKLHKIKQAHARKFGFNNLQMSMLNRKGEQCFPFVHCRDYLIESMYGFHNGKTVDIHKFTYRHTDPPLSLDKLRAIFRNLKEDPKHFMYYIKRSLRYLHFAEEFMRFPKTELILSKIDGVNYYVFESHRNWISNPYFMDLYFMIVMLGEDFIHGGDWNDFCFYLGINDYGSMDRAFLRQHATSIKMLTKYHSDLFGVLYHWDKVDDDEIFYAKHNIKSLLRENFTEDENVDDVVLGYICNPNIA